MALVAVLDVLATAVAVNAQVIITLNLKHFPGERQAAVLTRPPITIEELLDRLAATVPNFAQALGTHRS